MPLLARNMMSLLLGLCLGWLWGATPVAAQDEASPPGTEATGPYRNLAENHAGSFRLRQEDGVVFATFRTDRSPVQFLARDHPEVLFTVPKGFRPAVDVTWDISAQPVQTDGTPRLDQSDRRVFRMRVDTEGRVRYVDDSGVDGVGYLRYRTTLAWPLAGTEPRLCERKIRDGILKAVQALDDTALPCSQVDWTHLARILNLSLSLPGPLDADSERHSLLGLTNLTTLQVSASEVNIPAGLLVHTPRLEWLEVASKGSLALPAGLFRYTPLLAHLSLANNPHQQDLDLPSGLLAHVPHLDALQLAGQLASPRLKAALPAERVQQLLAHVPRLTRLTMTTTTPLPERFLTAVPHLTHLTVEGDLEPCDTPQLLAPVPHLRHIAVRMPADAKALACLADSLHRHTPALDRLDIELQNLQSLNAEVLPSLPRLTHLTLDVTGMAYLPEHLLAQAPALTHLTLHDNTHDGRQRAALTLPDGFFAHTPHLSALSLQVSQLNDLPPNLLTPVPGLRQVQIDTSNSTSLSARYLDRVPQLTELRMEVGRLIDLPTDFLMHAPHLEVLHLNTLSQESFPAHFLTYAPRLVEFRLHAPLQALPTAFLAHAPRLEVFHLNIGQYSFALGSLPKGFLTHAPRLVELHLLVPALWSLPTSFLGHAPRLETLELGHGYVWNYAVANKVALPIRGLPANFLAHAPRLQHLNLASLGNVAAFPPGFLSRAPQLRYLNLDANGTAALPADFLSQHPRLETIHMRAKNVPALPRGFLDQSPNLIDLKLDLQRVEALPEGFLANTPRLQNAAIDVHQVEAFPPNFLADAPHLASLNLRALNLTAWPADFLTHAPRVQTLGLAMPLLEPTLAPSHRLWDILQAASHRVKVTRLDPFYFEDPDFEWQCISSTIKLGDILEVEGRERDDNDRLLLRVRRWRERELFAIYGPACPYLIDARVTEPTFEVCASDRDPKECNPLRERYGDLSSIYG